MDSELKREQLELLVQRMAAASEKNTLLEQSLSAETRVKLDLFSALGEAKRQLEIRDSTFTFAFLFVASFEVDVLHTI